MFVAFQVMNHSDDGNCIEIAEPDKSQLPVSCEIIDSESTSVKMPCINQSFDSQVHTTLENSAMATNGRNSTEDSERDSKKTNPLRLVDYDTGADSDG